MKKLILIACTLLAVQAASAQKANIRYNLKKGEQYIQESVVKGKTTQSVMGMTVDTDMLMKMDIIYKITDVADDVYSMNVSYSRISQEVKNPYANVSYSSDGPETEPTNKMLKAMTQSGFSIKVASNGEVLEVAGLEELIDDIASSVSENPAEQAIMIGQMQQSFGEDVIKRSFDIASHVYREVSPGDKWMQETVYPSQGMDMNMNITYEYKGVHNGAWIIEGAGKLFVPDGTKMDMQGMSMDVVMSGDTTYRMEIDTATGWIRESVMNMPISGEISTDIPGQGRMIIGMSASNESVMTGRKL